MTAHEPSGAPTTPRDPAAESSRGGPGSPRPRRRRRGLKIFAWIFLILLVLLVGFVIALPSIISSDWGTRLVEQYGASSLEAPLEIGDLSVSWGGPQVIDGLRVGTPADVTPAEDLLAVERVAMDAGLWSILFGRREIAMEVDRPIVKVRRDQNGHFSYEGLGKKRRPTEQAPDDDDEDADDRGFDDLEGRVRLTVTKGELHFRDELFDTRSSVRDLDLSLDVDTPKEAILVLRALVGHPDAPPDAMGRLAMEARVSDLASAARDPQAATIVADGRAQAIDLRPYEALLFDLFGIRAPEQPIDGNFHVETTADGARGTIVFDAGFAAITQGTISLPRTSDAGPARIELPYRADLAKLVHVAGERSGLPPGSELSGSAAGRLILTAPLSLASLGAREGPSALEGAAIDLTLEANDLRAVLPPNESDAAADDDGDPDGDALRAEPIGRPAADRPQAGAPPDAARETQATEGSSPRGSERPAVGSDAISRPPRGEDVISRAQPPRDPADARPAPQGGDAISRPAPEGSDVISRATPDENVARNAARDAAEPRPPANDAAQEAEPRGPLVIEEEKVTLSLLATLGENAESVALERLSLDASALDVETTGTVRLAPKTDEGNDGPAALVDLVLSSEIAVPQLVEDLASRLPEGIRVGPSSVARLADFRVQGPVGGDVRPIEALTANGKATFEGSLEMKGVRVETLEADVRLREGTLGLENIAASVNRGKLKDSRLVLGLASEKPTFELALHADALELDYRLAPLVSFVLPMLPPEARQADIAGALSAQLELAGQGFELTDLKRTLAGSGAISLVNGRIESSPFFASLASLLGAQLDRIGFESTGSKFQIGAGKIASDQIYFEPRDGKIRRLAFSGQTSFDREIDYRVQLSALESAIGDDKIRRVLQAARGVLGEDGLPLRLGGTLAAPKLELNLDEIRLPGIEDVLRGAIPGLDRDGKGGTPSIDDLLRQGGGQLRDILGPKRDAGKDESPKEGESKKDDGDAGERGRSPLDDVFDLFGRRKRAE